MPEPKKRGFNLEALQAVNALDVSCRASEVLRETQNLSSAAKSAQAWMVENSAIARTQQFLRENAIGTLIAATEFKRAEDLKRLVSPYEGIQKILRPDAGILAAIEAAKQQDNLTARINVDLKVTQAFSKHLDQYRDIAKQYEASFHLPHAAEVARLLANMKLDGGTVAAYARQHMDDLASQRDLVVSMSRPWMREIEAARSVTALMELRGLGSALRSSQGFEETLTEALRSDLGDWRDRISFPQGVFDDPIVRTEFYVERGFNLSLTDFPEETFREGLVRVGLDSDSKDEVEWPKAMYAADAIEEGAFRRTNKCHNYLQRLERRLRQFIDEAMTAHYGADWPTKQLPPLILESWEKKKSRAENSGVILRMFIEVADFTDYEAIICRKDHWREVFKGRFKRQESVRESFQRLYPIRLATMHARFVTKEDELYVLTESMRLLSAIGS